MKEIIKRHNYLAEAISDRVLVQNTMHYEAGSAYAKETNSMIAEKKELNAKIVKYYDELRESRVGMYEDVDEFLERMENTLNKDDDGNTIFEYYKLGIKAIDDSFFDGKGVFQNSFIAIGADSGVGKTTLALQIISSLAYQGVKSQFFSFEMGDKQFFSEVSPQAKNKLKAIQGTKYAKNLTLDFHSRDINSLATAIQTRNDDGVKAFVIDSYLSIYAGKNEFEKMTEIVDMLATMKKELGILIIIIAQVSKSDSFNNVFEFSGGGKLKYECDVALFIKLVDGEEKTNKRHIHCEKNRILESKQRIGIITDYNPTTLQIEKLADFDDYAGVDADGNQLKKVKVKAKGFGRG